MGPGDVDQDAAGFERGRNLVGSAEVGIGLHPDQIGLPFGRLAPQAGSVGDGPGQDTGVLVVFRKTVEVVVQLA